MTKYEIEGGIDFYKQLNEYNQEENENENENDHVCLITNTPLTDKYVRLICGHTFNYMPIFNDIYNSKFKIQTVNTVATNYPSNKIKCPYCRNTQQILLPYYEDIGTPLIYGINTPNALYTLTRNKHNKFVYENTVTYFSGNCCYTCSEKEYCYEHIGIIKKKYNQNLKNIKKQQLKQEKEELKKLNVCTQILKSGVNKGKQCNCKAYLLNKCKKHTPKVNT